MRAIAEARQQSLLQRVLERGLRSADAAAAVVALADAAPRAVAEGLTEDPEAARRELGAEGVREIMDRLLAGHALRQDGVQAAVAALAECFAEDLSADGAAVAADVLGRVGRDAAARNLVDAALRKHPVHPGLLHQAALDAERRGAADDAHRFLTKLGRADPSPGTVGAVYRRRRSLPGGAPDVRMALLSTFTVDPLAPYLDLEARALGLIPEIYVALFNSLSIEILDLGSGLHRFGAEIVFVSAALDDVVPELAAGAPEDRLTAAGAAAVTRLVDWVHALRERSEALIVVHEFGSPYIGNAGLDAGPMGRRAWLRHVNARLAEALADVPRVHLLDLERVQAWRNGGRADDPKLRYLAGMRLGDGVLPDLARAYARYLVPLKGLTKKCIVLDLDNTLWGGIVGEDGPTGIRLGGTSPGIEFVDLQRGLRSLNERGVLLALNSKNNPDDALAVVRNHEAMVLREESFSAIRVNWSSKVENLRGIAEELGIGLDAMVFVDDSPLECELVRQLLPQVVTVELPRDPALYRATLDALPYFEQFDITEEDRKRAAEYRARRGRESLRAETTSLADYRRSLGLRVEIGALGPEALPRVGQLLQRTNQFNLTTRRHSVADLEGLLAKGWRGYVLRAEDRFGHHGLVAVALVEPIGRDWRIDTFLMSCRVIGHGIETCLLAYVARAAEAAGTQALVGEYRATAKNGLVSGFYPNHGFAPAGTDGAAGFRLSLPAAELAAPEWIQWREA